jgi:hypothetical protein
MPFIGVHSRFIGVASSDLLACVFIVSASVLRMSALIPESEAERHRKTEARPRAGSFPAFQPGERREESDVLLWPRCNLLTLIPEQ